MFAFEEWRIIGFWDKVKIHFTMSYSDIELIYRKHAIEDAIKHGDAYRARVSFMESFWSCKFKRNNHEHSQSYCKAQRGWVKVGKDYYPPIEDLHSMEVLRPHKGDGR